MKFEIILDNVVNEKEWTDLEYLQKPTKQIKTGGGLFSDTNNKKETVNINDDNNKLIRDEKRKNLS